MSILTYDKLKVRCKHICRRLPCRYTSPVDMSQVDMSHYLDWFDYTPSSDFHIGCNAVRQMSHKNRKCVWVVPYRSLLETHRLPLRNNDAQSRFDLRRCN